MCGRFTLRTPASVLVRQFALGAELQLPLRYNIAPTQQVPVDRMPMILSQSDYNTWLDPQTTNAAKLSYSFEPRPVDELTAYLVNPVVNSARHEGADCIEAA